MGQQQILLLVLSVILVTAAVSAGIEMFTQQAFESHKDSVRSDLIYIASKCIEKYIRPTSFSGFGRNYRNPLCKIENVIPWNEDGVVGKNHNAVYSLESTDNQQIKISAVSDQLEDVWSLEITSGTSLGTIVGSK